MEIKIIAQMEGKFEHTNRIYDVDGLAPTLSTPCGGGHIPKVLEVKKIGIIACFAMDGSENFGLGSNGGGISKTLKATTHDIAILERVWKSKK